jgi:hypothetical protein
MRKRHSNPGSAMNWLFSGNHLTDEGLLRSLDGELLPRESEFVDAHIQSCWSCRSRRRMIGCCIADLASYQNATTAPYLPPPLDGRAVFLARLDALASEMEHTSRPMSWLDGATRFFRLDQINQFARIAAVLVLLVSAGIFYFLRAPTIVSADELLNLTAASEVKSLRAAAEPVVVQKLRVSVGKKSLTRTVYRDVAHNRIAGHTEASGTEEAQIKAAYLKSSLDWNSPLDAETYRRWRETRPASRDRVVRLRDDQLILETTYSAGSVIEADLTVRIADYHAVKESFRFQDNSEIEIAELSYDVIPFASAPSGIFGVPAQLGAVRPSVASMRPVLSSIAELATAEVEVESVLHQLGADLGEQINIATYDGHDVSIAGVVSNDARKQELVSSLRPIPHTRLHILTVDEAAAQSPSSMETNQASDATSQVRVMVGAPPLLDSQLNTRFPDKDQRIAYVNQTLSLAQSASARAWALNRLADRHPPQQVAALDDDARRQLQVLVTDHVSALREDISSLQNQMAEILSGTSNTPAANTSVMTPSETGSSDTLEFSDDWRDRIRRIHSSTEAVHEAVSALLTSSQPSDQKDVNAIEVNLRTSLTQLQTELQVLDQKVHRTNLK